MEKIIDYEYLQNEWDEESKKILEKITDEYGVGAPIESVLHTIDFIR